MDDFQQQQQQLMSVPTQDQQAYPPIVPSQHPAPQAEGGFSSAFGLMSLDDPGVLAGLATDGAPYFSAVSMSIYAEDPNATPMPIKNSPGGNRGGCSNGSSSASLREAETRELREFWKTYMRTPLSGPVPDLGAPRRVRVNSLPSAKTPTADAPPPAHCANGTGANGTSSMRTTLHGHADDLRSYEAAVLARKTPTLRLAPRRRGNASASVSPQTTAAAAAAAASEGAGQDVNRPLSASSLAHAFGGSDVDKRRSAPESRESSLLEEGVGADVDVLRPSFKRLPSQTLGPERAKRALLAQCDGREGGGDVAMNRGEVEVPLTELYRRLSPASVCGG
jgi:hypothetical protein